MHVGMSLPDLLPELERRLATMEDFVADTRRMHFSVSQDEQEERNGDERVPAIVTLGVDLPDEPTWWGTANDHAQNQIAGRLGIPRRFWDRMRDDHPDILEDAVRKLLQREPDVRMVRTLDGQARAFLSNSYRRLDNYDLMDRAILPALKEAKMEVVSTGLTDTRLYIKALFPDVQEEIRKGDLVRCGVCLSNSEVGAGALGVEPFLYRLICTNGMIAPVRDFAEFGLRKTHVGKRIEDGDVARNLFSERTLALDDEAFFSMVYDLVRSAATGVAFAKMVDKMRGLLDLPIKGDPVAISERLAKTNALHEQERSSIMRHLIDEGDATAYGLLNSVTRTAGDSGITYDRATELEHLGGEMLAWSEQAWKELLSVKAAAE